MLEYIKKYKRAIILCIACFLLIIIGFPFVVHLLFKVHPSNEFWVAVWGAGDILNYFAATLSFAASIVLSALALWQTHKIKLESDEHQNRLDNLERKRIKPYIFFYSRKNNEMKSLQFTNLAQCAAKNLTLSDIRIRNRDGITIWSSDQKYETDYFMRDAFDEWNINIPDLCVDDRLELKMYYEDTYENAYQYLVREIDGKNGKPIFQATRMN